MTFLARLFGEKKKTAQIAKNRLALLIAHEHESNESAPDFLPELQRGVSPEHAGSLRAITGRLHERRPGLVLPVGPD